jgi:hypothetical protein
MKMAMRFMPDKIIPLGGNRCLVIPPGGWADFDAAGNLVEMSPDCIVTVDGYVPGEPPLWASAVPERLHPFPLEG